MNKVNIFCHSFQKVTRTPIYYIDSLHTEWNISSLYYLKLTVTVLLQCSFSWNSIMHNQTFTDDSECSGTTGLQRTEMAHVTPLFISLHWLPVAACIKFKTLMLAYRTATGSAPSYFHSLITIYIRDLWASIASWCHHREVQNHSTERFHSPFQAVGMNFPPQSGMLNPWQFSSDTLKLISFVITWLHLKKKKILTLFP